MSSLSVWRSLLESLQQDRQLLKAASRDTHPSRVAVVDEDAAASHLRMEGDRDAADIPPIAQRQQRAQLVIALLGVGLAITLWPYSTGLIGGPVLYVIFDPINRWLKRWLAPRVSAVVVVAIATFVLVVPGASVAGLVVNQAQEMAGGLVNSPLVGRLADLRLGDFEVGPRLVTLGENAVAWIGMALSLAWILWRLRKDLAAREQAD